MPDLPRHVGQSDEQTAGDGQTPTPGRRRLRAVLATVLFIAVLVAFAVLHLAGVLGPGQH